jgi:hypothetical protein
MIKKFSFPYDTCTAAFGNLPEGSSNVKYKTELCSLEGSDIIFINSSRRGRRTSCPSALLTAQTTSQPSCYNSDSDSDSLRRERGVNMINK